MPDGIKWILGITSLLLVGVGMYWFLSQEPAVIFMERVNESAIEMPEIINHPQASSEASPTPAFIEIQLRDCTNECSTFQHSPDQYVYCQNICGLSPDPTLPAPQPNDSILSKDIQQKNMAIKESDLVGCEAITEAALRKTCQVRVTEDLLE